MVVFTEAILEQTHITKYTIFVVSTTFCGVLFSTIFPSSSGSSNECIAAASQKDIDVLKGIPWVHSDQ